MTQGLIDHLGHEERTLLRRHGVRLRVDRITRDGRYALCSTCQVKHSLLRPVLSDIALVAIAHRAFAKLNHFGILTLISVVPKGPLSAFPAVDPQDPFQLQDALNAATDEDARLKEPAEHDAATIRTATGT